MNPASAIQAYKKIVQESQTLIFERVRLYKQLRESEADKRKIILTTIYKGVLREQELIVHTLSVVKLSLKKEITETFGTNSTAQPLENCLALLIESKEPINRAYGKALYALEKELLSEDCSPDTVAQILKTLKLNLQDFEVEFESIRNQLTNKHYLEQTTVIIEKRASEIVSETINTSLLKKYGLAVKNNALVFGPGLLVAAIGAAIGAKVIGEDRGLLSMTALMWFSALVPGYGTTFAQMYIQNKDTKYINPITGLFDSQLYAKDIVDFVLTDYLSDPISYTPAREAKQCLLL